MAMPHTVVRLSIACAVLAAAILLLFLTIGFLGNPRSVLEMVSSSEPESLAARSLPPITPEDINAIYKKVIHGLFVREDVKMVVIQANSTGFPGYEDEKVRKEFGFSDSFLPTVKSAMLEAEVATLEDYLRNNRRPTSVENLSDLGIKFVIFRDNDLKDAFPNRGVNIGWARFYKKYPRSPGIILLSNIGFNGRNTQSFLYAGVECGSLCGSGKYVLLKKENGDWVIQEKMELWVS